MTMEEIATEVELTKKRCRDLIEIIEKFSTFTSKITVSCQCTLIKLIQSELSFLSHASSNLTSLSTNIGHIEAVVHILQQPFITGVSRVCKPIPLSPSTKNGQETSSCSKSVYIDIVCTLNGKPVWIIASDRNPKYIFWNQSRKNKSLKCRIEQVLAAAQSSLSLKPSSIILFFSKGLCGSVHEKLKHECGAVELELEFSAFDFSFYENQEDDWINVLARTYRDACILDIKVNGIGHVVSNSECNIKNSCICTLAQEYLEVHTERNMGNSFCSLISSIKVCSCDIKDAACSQLGNLMKEGDFINFDTTALIALVSGISNGASEKLLTTPEHELRQRFKCNYEFVIGQVMSEIENPIHAEFSRVISGKRGIICESVYSEFKELVLMCGGPNEKLRADHLLRHLMIVPDSPSERIMSLPTTRKLALKNKIVFGTGDRWSAPTLTANMAFVRAVTQTGVSLTTIKHNPRALTGD